jgi:hypothetical protein
VNDLAKADRAALAPAWTEVRILSAEEAERERPALAEILADCVAGGASVSFMGRRHVNLVWPNNAPDRLEVRPRSSRLATRGPLRLGTAGVCGGR